MAGISLVFGHLLFIVLNHAALCVLYCRAHSFLCVCLCWEPFLRDMFITKKQEQAASGFLHGPRETAQMSVMHLSNWWLRNYSQYWWPAALTKSSWSLSIQPLPWHFSFLCFCICNSLSLSHVHVFILWHVFVYIRMSMCYRADHRWFEGIPAPLMFLFCLPLSPDPPPVSLVPNEQQLARLTDYVAFLENW